MNHRALWMLAACCAFAASCPAVADAANPLTGFYYGTATIEQPASIGTIDLAFFLDVKGTSIRKAGSYVDLEQTLLFPAVAPKIGGKDVGPRVSGTLGPTAFKLTTSPFEVKVGDKRVTRRVALRKATVTEGGASLAGTYTETVTGLTKDPLTIQGSFRLAKPLPVTADSGVDLNADGCLDLSEIRAGGIHPSRIEFSDLSAALNLYHDPQPNLRVGDPPGPNCSGSRRILRSALGAYYGDRP